MVSNKQLALPVHKSPWLAELSIIGAAIDMALFAVAGKRGDSVSDAVDEPNARHKLPLISHENVVRVVAEADSCWTIKLGFLRAVAVSIGRVVCRTAGQNSHSTCSVQQQTTEVAQRGDACSNTQTRFDLSW